MTTAGLTILAILTHTPIWVWALFAVVLFLGYQRTRDRTVQLWRLILLPIVMIVVAITGMVGAGLASLPAILVGLVVGGVSGWLLEREGATRRLPDGRLWLKGEWGSFLQIVAILAVRYTSAVLAATAPALSADPVFHAATLLVSSLLSAMILGRTLARLRTYVTSSQAVA
jgi:hypothetical protein